VALPNVAPGNYFLILVVDAGTNLFESDETNNILVTAITIN
jgi:subtilase family serine protease